MTQKPPCALNAQSFTQLKELESIRESKVLLIAASALEMEILPQLYEQLELIGKAPKLDVILYGRGGEVNAARRIALLLREYSEEVNFIVPYHCASSMTLLALSGNEIIAGSLACFSPIDPRLNTDGGDENTGPSAIASEDVRLFNMMSQEWFNVDVRENNAELLSALASAIFPTTLTSLYRSSQELETIASEMINFQLDKLVPSKQKSIIDHMIYGYHSHHYSITGEDLKALGLNIIRHQNVESLAWQIARKIIDNLGGGVRLSPDSERIDVIIASAQNLLIRKRNPMQIAAIWHEEKLI